MIRLTGSERLFISESLIAYADNLVSDGVFPRRIDFLLIGFAHAVNNNMEPDLKAKQHQLAFAHLLKDQAIAFEATAHAYAAKINHPPLTTPNELLNFICRLGITGATALHQKWQHKTKSQIQWEILS